MQRAARRAVARRSLFLNVGAKPTDPWTAMDVAQAARPHLQLQNTIHWIKSIAIEKALAGAGPGSTTTWPSATTSRSTAGGSCTTATSSSSISRRDGDAPLDRQAIGVRYQDQSNVGRWRAAASGVRCRGNTWFIPYETIQNREKDRPHPATFPPKLPEMCLRLHGLDRIQTVADPFLGLGSTAVACAQLGVSFVGIEMDEGYLKEADRADPRSAGESVPATQTLRPRTLIDRLEPMR